MAKKLLWWGSLDAVVNNGVIHVSNLVDLPNGRYAVRQQQNDGFRYASFSLKSGMDFLEDLLFGFKRKGIPSDTLEIGIKDNKFSLPQNLLDYLGLMKFDKAVI